VTARSLEFLIPGDPQTATGGYGYDRRIIAGLRALGWLITVHLLDASFPHPTAAALDHARGVFADIGAGALVLVDGLALGAMPQVVRQHAVRLALVALVHHPLAAESGLAAGHARRLERSERQALETVRHVVVTSRATKEALFAYGVAPERVSVVEPGTDEAPLARGHRREGVSMLCVAAVTPRKGHDVLVDALAPLTPSRWHLTCVGSLVRSPMSVERLRARLQRLGLDERVTLAGEASEDALAVFFRDADLFVLPSRHEGYGMAVAEALAHGLPVIGTCTGAVPALVGTKAGLLVPPDDAAMLRAALARVLNEPPLLATLAKEAALLRGRLPRWPAACAAMSHILEKAGGQPSSALNGAAGESQDALDCR
jgi:glycosyltransferase involved in cell wall biosynthesis